MQGKCDAEIGKPGNWRVCGRKATARIWSALHREMEYCDRHHNHAQMPHMKPAYGAKLEPIAKATT